MRQRLSTGRADHVLTGHPLASSKQLPRGLFVNSCQEVMDTDGAIDYSRFTRRQLAEALERIDRSRYPRNYANLTKALASRPVEEGEPNAPAVSGGWPRLVQRYRGIAQWLFPALQIYGGGSAAVNFGRQILGEGLGFGSAALLVAMIAFGLLSAGAGIRFYQGKPDAATLCFWAWTPQIPDFVTNHLSYFFYLPFRVTALIGLDYPRVAVEGQLALAFVARFAQEGDSPYVGVNVLALLAAVYFWSVRRVPR